MLDFHGIGYCSLDRFELRWSGFYAGHDRKLPGAIDPLDQSTKQRVPNAAGGVARFGITAEEIRFVWQPDSQADESLARSATSAGGTKAGRQSVGRQFKSDILEQRIPRHETTQVARSGRKRFQKYRRGDVQGM